MFISLLSSYRKHTVMNTNKALVSVLVVIWHTITSINCNPAACIGESEIIGQRIRYSNVEVNQYLGVPYAEPPIGDLRFMKTKPIKNMPKVFFAVRQPPACHQYTQNPFPWYINGTEKSEDCLFVNIWTPVDASPGNTKAVFYWIHGGGFRYGSIRDPVFSASALAALGDIVVVTVNYRLGPFGFLSSGTDDAPGNAGLYDLLEGLRWVNRNILAFGGDPSRITIAGESAGSIAVAMLGVSPLAKGLFARQIMESGSPTVLGFDEGEKINPMLAQKLATLVGCADKTFTIYDHPSDVIQCLKGVDAITLSRMDSLLKPHSSEDFFPQYTDAILPRNAYKAIANGEFCSSQLLIGVNRDEGSLVLSTTFPDMFGFFGYKDFQVNKTLGKDLIRKLNPSFPDPEALVNYYLPDALPENAYDEVRHRVYSTVSDTYEVCPSVYVAEKCAEKGNNVYFYLWVHRLSITPWAPWLGVAHDTEINFVFGQPIVNPQRYEPVEVEISSLMIQLWSSFVKYGVPSDCWPLYNKGNPVFEYLGATEEIKCSNLGPHRQDCDFLRPYFGA